MIDYLLLCDENWAFYKEKLHKNAGLILVAMGAMVIMGKGFYASRLGTKLFFIWSNGARFILFLF